MHSLMFGSVAIWLALAGSLTASILYLLVHRGNEQLRQWARLAYVMVAQGMFFAAFHLMWLIIHHRYEVRYVAEYSSSDLPTASVFGIQAPFYLVSCFWAGQQGTFFLWAIYGCLLGLLFLTRCPRDYEAPCMAVLALIEAFLALLLKSADPFVLSAAGQIPAEGQGLNILLQNHWMVIHPPIMFLGFSSLAIPFAVGIGALLRRDYDGWISVAWPWVLFAWCALGTGLFMGGYWAYTVLGWGGFWGWDNVENSSLIPWIATTALAHGMMLQRARGSMKRANLLFCLSPYLMVLFGSFLTRSGILADFSVHSFAAPDRILFNILIAFVVTFVVLAAGVFLSRVRSIPVVPSFEHEASRGFFFVVGTWVLYCCSLIVLCGTSWPLITGLMPGIKQGNVDQAFYNRGLFPVAILLCAMMGITPFMKWRGRHSEASVRVLGGCVLGATVLSLALTVANGFFFQQSLDAPADAIIRTNASAYETPRPSGAIFNDRTTAAGAVTLQERTIVSPDGQTFHVPVVPRSLGQAYSGALAMRNGYAYPIFAFSAFFCLLANCFMLYRITGLTRRSWLPAGGFLTHIGVGVLFVGIITSLNYGGDAVLNLDPGQREPGSQDQIRYRDGSAVNAFGRSFVFRGFNILQAGRTAEMQVDVKSGDESFTARPRLTYAKDGNLVHFPSILKGWLQDIYLSPIKLPGMGGQSAEEFRFHVQLEVGSQHATIKPGVAFSQSGMHATDTPNLPGTDYQVVITGLQTPTKDAPDRPTVLDLTLQRPGSFSSGAPTAHLLLGSSTELLGQPVRFVKFLVDPQTRSIVDEQQKETRFAQLEVSTKPLIDLVWLGTALIIAGGMLAVRRRTLEAGRRQAGIAGRDPAELP